MEKPNSLSIRELTEAAAKQIVDILEAHPRSRRWLIMQAVRQEEYMRAAERSAETSSK